MDTSDATEGPFIVLPFGPVSQHRISAAKGQNKVNEARCDAQISIDRTCCSRNLFPDFPLITVAMAGVTKMPVLAFPLLDGIGVFPGCKLHIRVAESVERDGEAFRGRTGERR